MEILIALVNIQYKGKLYIPGEEISEYTPEMAEAWKRAGSVKVLAATEEESQKEDEGVNTEDDKPETNEGESTANTEDENVDEKDGEKLPDKEVDKELKKEGRKKK